MIYSLGMVTRLAGTSSCSNMVDGTGSAASFPGTAAIATSPSGDIIVASSYRIRQVTGPLSPMGAG